MADDANDAAASAIIVNVVATLADVTESATVDAAASKADATISAANAAILVVAAIAIAIVGSKQCSKPDDECACLISGLAQ